jgi:hypothetical protein
MVSLRSYRTGSLTFATFFGVVQVGSRSEQSSLSIDVWPVLKRLYHLCGLVVRVIGYRSGGPGFDSWHYKKK